MTIYNKKNKKILLVHRYYYPDTPAYAVMLKKIAEHLAKHNRVDVLTSYPSYYGSSNEGVRKKEQRDNVSITRIRLLKEKRRKLSIRLMNTFLFSFFLFFIILFRKKYDVITVATTPPIIVATMIRLISRVKGNKYIYHCQDIYPEIAYYNNNLKSEILFKFLRRIDRKNNIKASNVIVLSEDMKNTLVNEREIKPDKISVINNFIRTEIDNLNRFEFEDYGFTNADFILTYCGNIGKLQNLDSIIKLAQSTADYPNIKYVFIGEGVEKQKLIKKSGKLIGKTIYFMGYLKSDLAVHALRQSDLGIVSISDPTYKTAYPSKTMTYLNAGLPIFAIINEQSELANFILKQDLGVVVNSTNIDEMKKVLMLAYQNCHNFDRKKIRKVAQKEFGVQTVLAKWSQLIENL